MNDAHALRADWTHVPLSHISTLDSGPLMTETPAKLSEEQIEVFRVLYPWYKEEVFRRREHMMRLTAFGSAFLVLLLITILALSPPYPMDPTIKVFAVTGTALFSALCSSTSFCNNETGTGSPNKPWLRWNASWACTKKDGTWWKSVVPGRVANYLVERPKRHRLRCHDDGFDDSCHRLDCQQKLTGLHHGCSVRRHHPPNLS